MFKKVLVPLDGSALAENALPYVRNLAGGCNVEKVILLTVAEVNIPYVDMKPGFDYQGFRDGAFEKFRKYLAGVEATLSQEGLKVESVVLEGGRPAQTIVDFSEENDVDLIVIATHGYTGVKKMLMGSVAFKILHVSRAPVLLIRPEASRK